MKIAPFRLILLLFRICLFPNGSVLAPISLVPYKYVPYYMYIVKDTYWIRIRVYVQYLKIV